MSRTAILMATGLLLSSCATVKNSAESYLNRRGITSTTTEQFAHCHGYGCKHIAQVSLSDKSWKDIAALFRPKPKTATQERAKIAKAIGLFERRVGKITGTEEDHYGTFKKMGRLQLDCVDESTNTTVYLKLLELQGLITHHSLIAPTMRVPIIHSGRWPHQTAIIIETETEERYAVDSWFHNNGEGQCETR